MITSTLLPIPAEVPPTPAAAVPPTAAPYMAPVYVLVYAASAIAPAEASAPIAPAIAEAVPAPIPTILPAPPPLAAICLIKDSDAAGFFNCYNTSKSCNDHFSSERKKKTLILSCKG